MTAPPGARCANKTSMDQIMVLGRIQYKNVNNWEVAVAKENLPMVLNKADYKRYVGTHQLGLPVVLDATT